MPRITDIKRQKRNENRYSIYIDDAYVFSLTDLDMSGSSLRVGQEIAAADIEYWQKHSFESKAYNQALGYIEYRRRSRREVDIYLARKDYEPEMVAVVLDRLASFGLLDDKAFAEAWLADRRALRPRSNRMLSQELRAKGVDRAIIDEVLDESEDDPVDILVAMIQKKRQLARFTDDQKLIAYLGRQGFSYAEIKEALSRLDDH